MRSGRTIVPALLLLAAGVAAAAAPAPAAPAPAGEEIQLDVVRHRLPNGLVLLVVERHTAPVVSAYLRFAVGSANEHAGVIGAAHFVEHMLFKGTTTIGTRDRPREAELMAAEDRAFDRLRPLRRQAARLATRGEAVPDSLAARIGELEAEAARLGAALAELVLSEEIDRIYQRNGAVELNASTGYDATQYFVSLPANRLELWARITADQMENPVFREFFAERDVVMEERRLRVDNQPDLKLDEQVIGTAYLANPYQIMWEWLSEVENISRPELVEFFRRHYSPNRAVIALVGDVRAADAIALVERYFGAIPAQPEPEPVVVEEPEQKGERRLVVEFDAEPEVTIAWHKTASGQPDDAVFAVIGEVLARGRTSRFYRRLVEGTQVAQDVSADQYPGSGLLGSADPGLFMVRGAPRAPHTAAELEGAILDEVAGLGREPVSAEELERVKTNLEADLIRGLRSNLGLAGALADHEGLGGDWRGLLRAPVRVRAVTAADVMRVARRYLVPSNQTVGWLERPAAADSGGSDSGGGAGR